MPLILMILGFIWWWPVGLAILAFLLARGRFGCGRRALFAGDEPMMFGHRMDRYEDRMARAQERMERGVARAQEKIERVRARMEQHRSRGGGWFSHVSTGSGGSSGNSAFDEYRAETLKRLEEEQREFKDFLGRLRFAKDRAEFDQFMNERRGGGPSEPPPAEPHG